MATAPAPPPFTEHVVGAPVPSESVLLERLRSIWGFPSFRTPQCEVICDVLAGRDAIVIMPTGRGKTLCYGLPAVVSRGVAIVVSPLVALMADQVRGFRSKGIIASALWSGMTEKSRQLIYDDLYNPSPTIKLLLVTPEGLQTSRLHALLRSLHGRRQLSLFAIDEAHCISSWGHSFRPDYRMLGSLRDQFPGVPVMALTASATPQVIEDIRMQLRMPGAILHKTSFDRPNLSYQFVQKDALQCVEDDMAERIMEVCGSGPAITASGPSVLPLLAAPIVAPAASAPTVRASTPTEASDNEGGSRSGRRTPPASVSGSAPRKGKGSKSKSGKKETPSRSLHDFFPAKPAASRAPTPPPAELPNGEIICACPSPTGDRNADPAAAILPTAAGTLRADEPSGTAAAASSGARTGKPAGGSAVIYTHKRDEAEMLAAELCGRGVSAAAYHAGMSDSTRSQIQRDWSEGRVLAVVATVAFGMGIDKADVRFVGHFTLPKSMEGLYQEAGRAGRDGLPAVCRVYYSRRDKERLEFITQQSMAAREAADSNAGDKRPVSFISEPSSSGATGTARAGQGAKRSGGGFDQLHALGEVAKLCESAQCRRVAILRHFGEKPGFTACDAVRHELCDFCRDPAKVRQTLQELYTPRDTRELRDTGLVGSSHAVPQRAPQLGSFIRGSALLNSVISNVVDISADDGDRDRVARLERHDAVLAAIDGDDEDHESGFRRNPRKRFMAPRRRVEDDDIGSDDDDDHAHPNHSGVAGVLRHPFAATKASRAAFVPPAKAAIPAGSGFAPASSVLRQREVVPSAGDGRATASAFQSARTLIGAADGVQSRTFTGPKVLTLTNVPRPPSKPQLVATAAPASADAERARREALFAHYERVEQQMLREQQLNARPAAQPGRTIGTAVDKVRGSVAAYTDRFAAAARAASSTDDV